MLNIKGLDPNQIKIDKKSLKNHTYHYLLHLYITIKNLSYVNINSVNPLYLITDKVDGYIEESNGSKYLMLVSIDKNKDTLKRFTEMLDKIKDLIRLVTMLVQ